MAMGWAGLGVGDTKGTVLAGSKRGWQESALGDSSAGRGSKTRRMCVKSK